MKESFEEALLQDQISKKYEQIRYNKPYSTSYHSMIFRKMLAFTDYRGGLILDEGCGTASLWLNFDNKMDVVGIDISKGMLEKASGRIKFLVNADAHVIPIKDNIFETIICKGLLHHVTHKDLALSEIYRVLKPTGQIILCEPIRTLANFLPKILIKREDHIHGMHLDFRKHDLLSLLTRNKLTIQKIIHLGYIAYPILGFPEIIDIFKYFPLKKILAKSLLLIDHIASKIPVLNTQSWAVMIKAIKR